MTNTKGKRSLPLWLVRLIGISSIAATIVSVAIYLYRQNSGSSRKPLPRSDGTTPGPSNSQASSDKRRSGWNLLGTGSSKSKSRKKVTISLKNTILWNPSSDAGIPNYAFHEHGQALLSQLIQHHDVYILIHVSCEEERKEMEHLLENGILEGLDMRKVLFCSTEEGKIHIIRHLEPQVHIEGGWEYDDGEDIIRKVRPFVAKLIWVITKRRRSSFNQTNLKESDQGILGSNVEWTDHILDTTIARELGFSIE